MMALFYVQNQARIHCDCFMAYRRTTETLRGAAEAAGGIGIAARIGFPGSKAGRRGNETEGRGRKKGKGRGGEVTQGTTRS